MATWIPASGLLLAAILPATALAQAADPFVIEENTMMGRTPSLPTDKRVAADVSGELTSIRGKAWWQVLSYCAGAYRYRSGMLAEQGDTAGSTRIGEQAKRFLTLGFERLETDRKISAEQADVVIGPELEYATLSAEDGGDRYRPFAVDEQRCREVLRVYLPVLRAG